MNRSTRVCLGGFALVFAGCVETDEPSLGATSAEVITSGTRPQPLNPPDILWENGPSVAYHAYIPPGRSTHDGRLVFESESPATYMGRCFRLVRPEMLGTTHLSNSAQVLATALNERKCESQDKFHGTSFVFGSRELGIQGAVCDAAPDQPAGPVDPRRTNAQPKPCESDATRDCYFVTTFTHMMTPDPLVPEEVWSRPWRIEVSNPKTATAKIELMTPLGPPVKSEQSGSILEPVVSGDGRVLVYHDGRDTKYSVNASGAPCDASAFNAARSISHFNLDPLTQKYGLSKFKLRSSENVDVAPGAEVGGAYPWIDRDVSNLFVTTAGASLYYQTAAGAIHSKYPVVGVPHPSAQSPNPPLDQNQIRAIGDIGGRSGITVMGLWTQGKMVVLDNRMNNSDLAILEACNGTPDATGDYCNTAAIHDRLIRLYHHPVTGAPIDTRIGASNSFFINSVENVLNYDPEMRPVTPADVVWQMSATTGTDEVAFDDYLLPRALIISPMNPPTGNTEGLLKDRNYKDGFVYTGTFTGEGWTGNPRVQNASGSTFWQIPASGALNGGARLEPIAAGGVKGKGIWLDGVDDRIDYSVPIQTQATARANSAWMYSLWINPTTALTATQKRLLTTPDTSELLISNTQLIARRGTTTAAVTLPAALVPATNRWTHLAVVSTPTQVSFYVDGFLLASPAASNVLRMGANTAVTTLTVGGTFTGWIDEAKVIARAPNPEELCNHAYGTLVGVSSGMPGFTKASLYPASSHTAIGTAYPAYYCESQAIANAGAASTGYLCKLSRSDARCVGKSVLAPGAQLLHGVPRPVTTGNAFCESCHVANHPSKTLSLDALRLETTAAEDDRRRQPLQPEPLLFGRIPAGLFGGGLPASTIAAIPTGYEYDVATLPAGTNLCVPSATRLCLMNRRFAVTLSFVHPNTGLATAASAVTHTPNTGHFWFFSATNLEVTVKALDGFGVNQKAWIFQSGITSVPYTVTVFDHFTNTSKNYPANAVGGDGTVCGTQDTTAFLGNAPMGGLDAVTVGAPLGLPPAGGNCVPGPARLCAINRRYEVTARYKDSNNVWQPAQVRGEQTNETGFFTFFDGNNLELIAKVLDGTGVNGKIWLFYGSLTGVVFDITLRDTVVPRQVTFTSTTGPQNQQCGKLVTTAL